jgi:hypothetical protein
MCFARPPIGMHYLKSKILLMACLEKHKLANSNMKKVKQEQHQSLQS